MPTPRALRLLRRPPPRVDLSATGDIPTATKTIATTIATTISTTITTAIATAAIAATSIT